MVYIRDQIQKVRMVLRRLVCNTYVVSQVIGFIFGGRDAKLFRFLVRIEHALKTIHFKKTVFLK